MAKRRSTRTPKRRGFSRSWRSAETLVQVDNPDDLEQVPERLTQESISPHTLVRMDNPDDGYVHDPGALGLSQHIDD